MGTSLLLSAVHPKGTVKQQSEQKTSRQAGTFPAGQDVSFINYANFSMTLTRDPPCSFRSAKAFSASV